MKLLHIIRVGLAGRRALVLALLGLETGHLGFLLPVRFGLVVAFLGGLTIGFLSGLIDRDLRATRKGEE